MKRFYTIALLLTILTTNSMAQLKSYIPASWSYNATLGYYNTEGSVKYYKHKLSSEHFDVYYGTDYGKTAPNELSSSNDLYVDVSDLLEKAEMFFDVNVNKLKFADLSNSKLSKYKMMICLLHDTGWTCTGSGYDNTIGALWVTPSTCHPVGQSIGHEIGHAFQYQCYSDLGGYAGFRYANGSGSSFWEQTAQWQSVIAYPSAMMSESMSIFPKTYNYAFTHEWQRYQSYWLHFYWAEKHGIDAIGKIWRGGTISGEDPCQVYMRVFDVTTDDFYKEIYDYAAKMATFDMDVEGVREKAKSYIGTFKYNFEDTLGDIQVAYSSCPQSTGFNLLQLKVPSAGTEIKTVFTALPAGTTKLVSTDPAYYMNEDSKYVTAGVTKYNTFTDRGKRGFRHGYVALLKDGTRVYQSVDTVYAKGTATRRDTTSFVVPANTQKLFFVVSPSPTKYIVHNWDSKITNDDQWPYRVSFENTDLIGHYPSFDLSDTSIQPSDTTLNFYVGFDASSDSNDGLTYFLKKSELQTIAEKLRVQPSAIKGMMKKYSATQANNTIMLLPLNPNTNNVFTHENTTTNNYGHWFNSRGAVCTKSDADAKVSSEFDPSGLSFIFSQNKGKLNNGDQYKVGQAFRYKDANGKKCTIKLIFHIYVGGVPDDITEVNSDEPKTIKGIYDLTGRSYPQKEGLPRGIYIIDGKKVLIK